MLRSNWRAAAAHDMALARIISSSRQCARELALDLMERGYAVEIVAPDAIPDNLADLELRVEADPSNVLTASVKARDGERSTSLDFVHHLKAPVLPMPDFQRRPAQITEGALVSPGLTIFEVESPIAELSAEPVELAAAELPRTPEPAPVAPEIVSSPDVAVRPTAAPVRLQKAPKKPERRVWPVVRLVFRWSKAAGKTVQKSSSRPRGWFWRAAATSAGVLTVAVLVGFGIRGGGAAPLANGDDKAVESGAQTKAGERESIRIGPSEAAVPTPFDLSAQHSPVSVASAASKDEVKSGRVAKVPAVPRVKSAVHSGHKGSYRHNDLVAPNTITYLDRPGSNPIPVEGSTHSRGRNSGGVVAASSVTHLNGKARHKAESGK